MVGCTNIIIWQGRKICAKSNLENQKQNIYVQANKSTMLVMLVAASYHRSLQFYLTLTHIPKWSWHQNQKTTEWDSGKNTTWNQQTQKKLLSCRNKTGVCRVFSSMLRRNKTWLGLPRTPWCGVLSNSGVASTHWGTSMSTRLDKQSNDAQNCPFLRIGQFPKKIL